MLSAIFSSLSWQVSRTVRGRKCHSAIRNWILWLVKNHCFCPEEFDRPFDYDSNVSCYISSPGTEEGGVNETTEVKNVLRYSPPERGTDKPSHVVGKKIFKSFGSYLTRYCHFGPESSIMDTTIEKVQGFVVDLRPVMNCSPIYDVKKHLEKLGLQAELPGLCRSAGGYPDNFLRLPVVWKSRSGGIGSEGAGVNMFSLLSAASLLGCNHIHCKSSSRFAQAVMRQFLKKAPFMVGDSIPVRSFHDQTREPEVITVGEQKRPPHFMRPIRDDGFTSMGIFSVCPEKKGKMPEDYAHCGAVEEQCDFLGVTRYADMLPELVQGHYQLIPGLYYALYDKVNDSHGYIVVKPDKVVVRMNGNEVFNWDFFDWQDKLKKHKLLVLPMVWRSGALVLLDDGETFGCLVPKSPPGGSQDQDDDDEDHDDDDCVPSNYNHRKTSYNVLVNLEEDLLLLSTLDVLDNLVSPGTFVWIKPGTDAWSKLSMLLPFTELDQEDANQRMIRGRLNIPTVCNPEHGKVYVTVLQRNAHCMRDAELDYRHVVVDPWELSPNEPERKDLQVIELNI